MLIRISHAKLLSKKQSTVKVVKLLYSVVLKNNIMKIIVLYKLLTIYLKTEMHSYVLFMFIVIQAVTEEL